MPGYRVNHQCDATDKEQLEKKLTSFYTEKAIPMDGEMTFDGKLTDILDSLRVLLGGSTVRMHVSWFVAE